MESPQGRSFRHSDVQPDTWHLLEPDTWTLLVKVINHITPPGWAKAGPSGPGSLLKCHSYPLQHIWHENFLIMNMFRIFLSGYLESTSCIGCGSGFQPRSFYFLKMTIIILDIIFSITYKINYLALLKNLHCSHWNGPMTGYFASNSLISYYSKNLKYFFVPVVCSASGVDADWSFFSHHGHG